MHHKRQRQIINILFLFVFFWGITEAAEKTGSLLPPQLKKQLMLLYNTNETNTKRLKKEILARYISQGEEGLRRLARKRKSDMTPPVIIEIVASGFTENNLELFRIAVILIEEKKKENPLNPGDIDLYDTFFIFTQFGLCQDSQSLENFLQCLNKLIPLIEKINSPSAQEILNILKDIIYSFKKDFSKIGKTMGDSRLRTNSRAAPRQKGQRHLLKGALYINSSEYMKACEELEKALMFLKKTNDAKGKSNLYMLWGTLYRRIGDYTRAVNMYDKALPFLEKTGDITSQFNIHKYKAGVYEGIGEHIKAIRLYDQALLFLDITKNNTEKASIYLAKGEI